MESKQKLSHYENIKLMKKVPGKAVGITIYNAGAGRTQLPHWMCVLRCPHVLFLVNGMSHICQKPSFSNFRCEPMPITIFD